MYNTRSRRAFTLIELMVVIAIIAILAGLVMTGMSLMNNRQRAVNTRYLMRNIGLALDAYLERYPLLGDDDSLGIKETELSGPGTEHFVDMPLRYLNQRWYDRHGGARLLEIQGQQGFSGDPSDPQIVAASLYATGILDAWRMPLLWTVENAETAGLRYTNTVRIRSLGADGLTGTPATERDDIVYSWDQESGNWSFK